MLITSSRWSFIVHW